MATGLTDNAAGYLAQHLVRIQVDQGQGSSQVVAKPALPMQLIL